MCSTGIAGGLGDFTWFCPSDLWPNSMPNGGGQSCFTSAQDCIDGPNSCGTETPCSLDVGMCATGMAGGSGHLATVLHLSGGAGAAGSAVMGYQWFCESDQPLGSLPTGSGLLSYDTLEHCMSGATPL